MQTKDQNKKTAKNISGNNTTQETQVSYSSTFLTGFHCHIAGRYEDAVKCYKEAAKQGSIDALYYLALCYYEGKGVEKDLKAATKCFEEIVAASDETKVEANFIPRGFRIRNPIQKSIGEYKREAQMRLEKLADIDSGKGIGILDYRYAGNYIDPIDKAACTRYKKLWLKAEEGDPKAQKKVAEKIHFIISWFNDPDADGETMMRYFKSLAEQGDIDSLKYIVSIYHSGYSSVGLGTTDHKEKLKWFRMAAEKDLLRAKEWLEEEEKKFPE